MNGTRVITANAVRVKVAAPNQWRASRYGRTSSRAGARSATTGGLSETDAGRMRRDGLPDEGLQLVAEDLSIKLASVLAQLDRIPGDRLRAAYRVHERAHFLALEQHTRLAVDDGVQCAARRERDHGSARGVGLQRRDAEIF